MGEKESLKMTKEGKARFDLRSKEFHESEAFSKYLNEKYGYNVFFDSEDLSKIVDQHINSRLSLMENSIMDLNSSIRALIRAVGDSDPYFKGMNLHLADTILVDEWR